MNKGDNNEEEGRLAKKIKNFIYHPGDQIGSGFSSQVFKGINELETDPLRKSIAIKVIELSKIQNEVEKYLLNNEVNALKVIKHPNILDTVDILMTKNNVYIITEFCEGGDLLKYIKEKGPLNEVFALELTSQILEGYTAIEEKNVIHRDLKTANIFLTKNQAKIADFGFCEFIGEKKPQVAYNVGSPAYMSPESYRENQYSVKSDIWAIAIILSEFLLGETPYRNLTYTEMVNNLTSGKIQGIRNEEIRKILVQCFKRNVVERIGTRQFLEKVKQELDRIRGQEIKKVARTNSNPSKQAHQQSPHQPQSLLQQPQSLPPQQSFPQSQLQPQPPHHPPQQIRNSFNPHLRNLSPMKMKREPRNSDNHIHPPPPMNPNNQMKLQGQGQGQGGSQASHPDENSRKSLQSNQHPPSLHQLPPPSNIKSYTEMLLFLYRLLKFVVDIKWQRLSSILLVIFRHRNMINQIVLHTISSQQDEPYKQFSYLLSRFDEIYLEHAREVPANKLYKDQLDSFVNHRFNDHEPLLLYRTIIREACGECELIIENKNSGNINFNQIGIILDYLMIEFEILGLYLEANNSMEVGRIINIEKIVKEQPRKLTNAHLQLLKIRSKIIFGNVQPFTRHSAIN